jgi:hypothetical protein
LQLKQTGQVGAGEVGAAEEEEDGEVEVEVEVEAEVEDEFVDVVEDMSFFLKIIQPRDDPRQTDGNPCVPSSEFQLDSHPIFANCWTLCSGVSRRVTSHVSRLTHFTWKWKWGVSWNHPSLGRPRRNINLISIGVY